MTIVEPVRRRRTAVSEPRHGAATRFTKNVRRRNARLISANKCLRLVCVLLILDVILNQINSLTMAEWFGLSTLQVYRGLILCAGIWCLICWKGLPARRIQFLGYLLWAIVVFCLLQVVIEIGIHEQRSLSGLSPYFQVMYWSVIGLLCLRATGVPNSGRRLANTILAVSAMIGLSVLLGYAFEYNNNYLVQGVRSSSGLFVTAKGIAGQLCVGIILSVAYISYYRTYGVPLLIIGLCSCALLATQARTGLIALIGAALVLFAEAVLRRPTGAKVIAAGVLACSLLYTGTTINIIDTITTHPRWSDITSETKAGSGRILMWRASVEEISSWDIDEVMIGLGHSGMLNAMRDRIGMRIHTHSDLFDLLLVGGIAGAVLLGLFLASLWKLSSHSNNSAETKYIRSACTVIVVSGLFTGQFFGADLMLFYVASICALNCMEQSGDRRSRSQLSTCKPVS